MMKTRNVREQGGFTLIETLMAMAIFTIGILGLFGMQTAAIKENLSANTITTGSTWATHQVEQLIAFRYIDLAEKNNDIDRCLGINDSPVNPDSNRRQPDGGPIPSGTVPPIYRIYWNVADNCFLSGIPDAAVKAQEQKPKLLRIIVTVDKGSGEKETARFSYIKQNTQTGQ